MTIISEADHERIRQAITDVETRTSGEIYCVLARRSDDYFLASSAVIFVAILLASIVAVFVADLYLIEFDPIVLVTVQIVAAALAIGALKIFPGMRLLLVPPRVRFRRAHANARGQFLAHNIHRTRQRTGILLFISLAEHYAEVIADSKINDVVDQEEWNNIVGRMIDHCKKEDLAGAFVGAVERSGVLLAERFPPSDNDENELDDHLIVL